MATHTNLRDLQEVLHFIIHGFIHDFKTQFLYANKITPQIKMRATPLASIIKMLPVKNNYSDALKPSKC